MKKFLKLNLPLAFLGLFAFSSGLLAEHHEHSDDLREVGAKLKQAVEDGKLSKKDAWVKWIAAARQKRERERDEKGGHDKKDWGHRGHGDKDRHDGHDSHSELREYGEKLKQAVEDGKLSKKDAWAKWLAAARKKKEGAHEKGGHDGGHDKKDRHDGHDDKDRHDGRDSHSDLREYGSKLKQAVEDGKLSKKDAWAKWMAAARKKKEEHHEKGGHDKRDWGHRGHDDKDRHDGRDSHSDLREVGAKLKQAVEDGKLSKKDAWAKWLAAARKKKEEHHEKGGHDGGHDKKDWGHRGHDKDRHDGHDSHSDLREYGEKLKQAVEDGKLSQKDAWAKWMAAARSCSVPRGGYC